MRPLRPIRAEDGFTFVEVMIAMFILSFIVSGLAMVSIHAAHSSTYAERLMRANMLAEAAVEWSRNTAFESLANARTETVSGASVAETCTTAAPVTTCTFTGYPPFTRTRTVEYRTSGISATSYTAATTVTVSWPGARGETQRVGVSSVISKF